MSGSQKIEYASLYVEDIDVARTFYTDVMGLTEVARDSGVTYLSCGVTDSYDLAIEEGGTGIDHVAIRVDEASVDECERDLRSAGVEAERVEGSRPGVQEGVGFELPSGVGMELVAVDAPSYRRPFAPEIGDRNPIAPVDLDHVNLMSQDVEREIRFLEEHAGQRISEVSTDEDTGEWLQAFTRAGDTHHDLGCTKASDPDHTLHHVAWLVADVSHLVRLLDHLAQHDVRIEVGVTRHAVASNVVAYFWAPGGNRLELTTEMATLDESAEPIVHGEWTEKSSFTAWGGIEYPETWGEGT